MAKLKGFRAIPSNLREWTRWIESQVIPDATPEYTPPATLGMLYTGTGSPESKVIASKGSLYLNSDGGASTTLYVKESGNSDTGWVAK